MTPTSTQREERYRAASESVRDAYAGEEIGGSLRAVFDAHQLREELYREYALAFGDVVLGFVDSSQMGPLIQERLRIPEPIAIHLASELRKLLPQSAQREVSGAEDAVATPPQPEVTTPKPAEKQTPTYQAPPAWSHISETAEPQLPEAEGVDEQPFYPRVPNYSKPMTNPPSRPPQAPRSHDPYHEPIE